FHGDARGVDVVVRAHERLQFAQFQRRVVRQVREHGVEQTVQLQRVRRRLVDRSLADRAQEVLLARNAIEVAAGVYPTGAASVRVVAELRAVVPLPGNRVRGILRHVVLARTGVGECRGAVHRDTTRGVDVQTAVRVVRGRREVELDVADRVDDL